jgi:uncharacterized membrane protein YphA (DoxX/SURF4 family)
MIESPQLLDVIAAGARFAVGGLLIVAGLAKLGDRDHFSVSLRRFPIANRLLVTDYRARLGASGLAVAEVLSGMAFMTGYGIRVTALVILILLSVFSLAVSIVLLSGQRIPCGCFGSVSSDPVTSAALVRNAVLIGLTCLGYTFRPLSLDALLSDQLPSATLVGFLLIASQIAALTAGVWGLSRLRSVPGYVRHVPKLPVGSLGMIWEGMPEVPRRVRRRQV